MLAAERDTYANVVFDGRGDEFRDLIRSFSGYLFRFNEGQRLLKITDTPVFVDSATSVGIQIADMRASVIRIYHERQLSVTSPSQDDEYQRGVRSWYRYVENQARDMVTADGAIRYGLHRLPVGVR